MYATDGSTFITLDDGRFRLRSTPRSSEVLWHGFGAQTPERALLLAASSAPPPDLKNFRCAQRANQRSVTDAYLWVASDDRSHPFAFENVCEFPARPSTSARSSCTVTVYAATRATRWPTRPDGRVASVNKQGVI